MLAVKKWTKKMLPWTKNQQKKNLDNVSDEKPSNAKALGKSNCESNF